MLRSTRTSNEYDTASSAMMWLATTVRAALTNGT